MASGSGSHRPMQMGRQPCFIQVVRSPSKNTESLVIPPPFVIEFMNGDRCRQGKIKLEGLGQCQWRVEINTDGVGVELGEGWAEFVGENLVDGWMLVLLRYEGAMTFSARRYGRSGALMVTAPRGRQTEETPGGVGGIYPSFAQLVIPGGMNSEVLKIPAGIFRGGSSRTTIESKVWLNNMNWGMSCNARIRVSEDGGVIKGGWDRWVSANIVRVCKWCIVDYNRSKNEASVMAFLQCGGVMSNVPMMNAVSIGDAMYVDSCHEEYPEDSEEEEEDLPDGGQAGHMVQFPIPQTVIRVGKKYGQLPTEYAKQYFPGVGSRQVVVRTGDGQSWEVSFVKSNETYRFSGGFVELKKGYGLKVGNKCKLSYQGNWVFVMEKM